MTIKKLSCKTQRLPYISALKSAKKLNRPNLLRFSFENFGQSPYFISKNFGLQNKSRKLLSKS